MDQNQNQQQTNQAGNTGDDAKTRVLQKLAVLEKYKKLNGILAKESEKMEELKKSFQDEDDAFALKEKIKNKK